MGIEIPEALQWVAKYVVGAGDWPEGDETAMRRVESAWTQLATDLQEIGPDANHAIDQVLAAIEGDTAQAISDRWTELGHGKGAFDGLIKHIETLGDEIGDGAADIEHTKLVVIASLAIFAVEMAALLAVASTGVGAPAAGARAAASQTITRIAIRTAIKQLLQRMATKAAMKAAARAAVRGAWAAALEETALDLGIKAVQVATGRRDEISTEDLTEAGKNALTAAATGAVTGAMGPDGLTTRDVPGGPEGGNPLANAAADAAKETVAGVAGEVAGEATDAALNDREFSLEEALSPENLSSAASAGVQRGTETLGENNSSDTGNSNDNDNENTDDQNPQESENPPGDDPESQPQGQNQSQGQQNPPQEQQPSQSQSPNGQPSSPDGPAQTQSASSGQQPQDQPSDTGQQPQGQPTDTGQQPASEQPSQNDTPSPPPTDTPEQGSPSNEAPTAPETQQPPQPESPQPTDTGSQETPQPHPTDTGSPTAPQPSPDTGTPESPDTGTPQSPDAGTSQPSQTPDPQQSPLPGTENQSGTQTPAPPTQDTAAPQQPTSSLNLSPDAPPQQPTSSLNLGPETGAPTTPGTPGTSETSPGQAPTTPPGTTTPTPPPTAGTPTSPPTTQHQSETATPPTAPGEATPAGAPNAPSPTTGSQQPPANTPESTPTATSAASTASPTLPPPGPVAPPSAPSDTPRTATSPDPATGSPSGTTPAGSPRNQPRATTPQRPGETTPTEGTRPQTPETSAPPSGPITPGYDYNIYDPANHARFLADFSRPPIPTRATNTGPTPDRDSSTPNRAPTTEDPSTSPNRADNPTSTRSTNTPTRDGPHTDRPTSTTPAQTPHGTVTDPGRANSSRPNAPRPTDPIWNSPHQTHTTPPRTPTTQPPNPHTPTRTNPANTPPTSRPNPHAPNNPRPTVTDQRPDNPHFAPPPAQRPHHGAPPQDPNRGQPTPPAPRRSPSPMDQVRALREHYRTQPPLGNRSTGVPAHGTRYTNNRPSYTTTQHRLPNGETLHIATVRVHLSTHPHTSPDEVRQIIRSAEDAADRAFNTGPQLLSGDRLMVDVVFTTDPADAHLSVNNNYGDNRNQNTWSPQDSPAQRADSLRMHMGLMPTMDSSPLNSDDLRQISNDIALANTEPRFSNPSDTRIEGPQRLAELEDPRHQTRVEDCLRDGNRYTVGADPRTHPYGQRINDGGPTVPGRSNNCLDCALSALSSFFGNPQVSAPRFADTLPDGSLDTRGGERGGPERAAQWLGSNWSAFVNSSTMPIPDQFRALHDLVNSSGPGSAALVGNYWHARDENGNLQYDQYGNPVIAGGHATVIVFPRGPPAPSGGIPNPEKPPTHHPSP
ncbi:toxin glutamine deamidase domain-containing protein [Nocardia sp. NPDC058499]|uniref:toxin glutamine deamidase domain-containing protein n=1 Tax=Nocardia sp. NPDC058499 TaxID=3346530 RepID=UPI003655D13A